MGLLIIPLAVGIWDWILAAILSGLATLSFLLSRLPQLVTTRSLTLNTTTNTAVLRWQRIGCSISTSCLLSSVRVAVHRVELDDSVGRFLPILPSTSTEINKFRPLFAGSITLVIIDDLWIVIAATNDLDEARAAARRLTASIPTVQVSVDPEVTVRGYFHRPIGYRQQPTS